MKHRSNANGIFRKRIFWKSGPMPRAYDGTVSMVQPLIAPLYAGRSAIEVLDLLLTGYLRGGYEIVREFWAAQHARNDFESVWRRSLEKGIWLGNFNAESPPLKPPATTSAGPPRPPPATFDLIFRPDPCVWDGSYTNNAFLQETRQAAHQTDLGQRGPDQREQRAKARRIQRRHAANHQRGPVAGYSRMDFARLAG